MDREFVNNIEIAHVYRLSKRSAGSSEKVLESNRNILSTPTVVKFVTINDKQTILRRTIYAKQFNVAIIQYLLLAMKQQRRDLLGIAKSFHSEGEKIKWRIIGSDYCLFIDENHYIPKQK